MSLEFDEAKRLLGLLREATEGEPCSVQASEDEWSEDLQYDLHLVTPTYELTAGIMDALHNVGPFNVRHLGQVKENNHRHVWVLKEAE